MTNINPVTDLVTALSGKMNLSSDVVVDIIELNGDETYPLPAEAQIIRVLSGRAWITVSGEDRIMENGEDTLLETGKEIAVISSLHSERLVFEVQYA